MATADAQHATISDRVDELHRGMAGQMPDEVLAAFGAEQAGLDARGLPAGVATPGAELPDARLLDVHGASTTLADTIAGRTAVVVLYRGAWCPYCNLTLRAYQEDLAPTLQQRGTALVAISPQKPDGSLTTQQKNDLSFTVLSDPGNQVATALGVLTAPTDDARAAQRTVGLDLPDANADGGYGLPMPTVAVVDTTGTIRWIDVHPNYTTRTEVADILTALDALP
ncbi:peroxiredoxin-like family protein [Tsukamurella sp. 8F]|uniref:peroxiredoxin-like family protein n=1 Tax=unclassified Tsukamurella TaxID=2633480 RepID=UPI0023BA2D84|nr:MULTISPECIES: peroxiredoxin-like family protein [unclassified Tsukamurella]MDF0531398.1 peroxiredoxin-like family protein [Tsukamurella sp. 8J]MDF0585296.1 peroxiredoxin-like family protein [Tsukamurella sp. 8F]